MPDINGLDFIRSLANPPLVIFVTAYPEFAIESYKVNALDYLLKPYGGEDFQRTAEKAYKQWQLIKNQNSEKDNKEQNVLYLKSEYKYLRVECDNIKFIEGHNEYLKIHLVSGDPFLTHMTFKQIAKTLPKHFIHIHRSYIVNMKHVISFERTTIILNDDTHLPVSETRKNDLVLYLKNSRH